MNKHKLQHEIAQLAQIMVANKPPAPPPTPKKITSKEMAEQLKGNLEVTEEELFYRALKSEVYFYSLTIQELFDEAIKSEPTKEGDFYTQYSATNDTLAISFNFLKRKNRMIIHISDKNNKRAQGKIFECELDTYVSYVEKNHMTKDVAPKELSQEFYLLLNGGLTNEK